MKPLKLTTLALPPSSVVRVTGLRQLVTLGPKPMSAAGSLSPDWSFPDGNIAWKLRFRKR